MKSIPSWLLILCIVIGQLSSPTQGADMKWDKSVKFSNDAWHFKLLNVPSRGKRSLIIKLYQEVNGTNFVHLPLNPEEYKNPPKKRDHQYVIPHDYFKPGPKIVQAKVFYPDSHISDSNTVNLEKLLEDNGAIVGGTVGGVCFVILVVLGAMCQKRRRRRVRHQQPAAVVVPQTAPQVMYV